MNNIMHKLLAYLFRLDRKKKQSLLLSFDITSAVVLFPVAFFVRSENIDFLYHLDAYVGATIALLAAITTFLSRGLYSAFTRHLSTDTVVTITIGSIISGGFLLFGIFILDLNIPRSTPIIYSSQLCLVTISFRFLIRSIGYSLDHQKKKNVAIFGAGFAGEQLLEALKHNEQYRVRQLIDEDSALLGKTLAGIPIQSFDDAKRNFKKLRIEILLIPSTPQPEPERQKLLEALSYHPLQIKTIPSISSLISDSRSISGLEDIKIEDLLGRKPVQPDAKLMAKNILGKTVLVTGAGGSIGSELCRQIFDWAPTQLILLDLSEYSVYALLEELKLHPQFMETTVTPIIGSTQDKKFVENVFDRFSIDTVYHAAAYKHVPLMEQNVMQCIANNVLGTLTLAETAIAAKVSNFTLISTDKAVNPTNFMGASKRFAELICQTLPIYNGQTRFSIVRFGNVLGSSGSVVPLFRKQVEKGGPITITHKDVERYFMTITEASQLVIQASSMAKGGEVFVLDMGLPIKILDLAKKMVNLLGLNYSMDNGEATEPNTIPIKIIGLRPREKLHEQLSYDSKLTATPHPRIMTAVEQPLEIEQLDKLLSSTRASISDNDYQKLFQTISSFAENITSIEDSTDSFAAISTNNNIKNTSPTKRATVY